MSYFIRSMTLMCLLSVAMSVRAADYGDAPSPYPTLLANDGARHTVGSLFLGTSVDDDADGQPNATGTGDDADGADDEGGVAIPSALFIGKNTSITVTVSEACRLDAWIDFNDDGNWADAGEQVFTNQALVAGVNTFTVAIPGTAVAGPSFARFRVSTGGGLAPTGAATDGEVEDYEVTISPVPSITSATYNAGVGSLVVTGADLPANNGGGDIDASTLTFTGEGGGTYALTDTSDVEITNSTTFTLKLSATDKAAVNLLLNQNGTTSSTSGTPYNLAAADGWAAAGGATATIADATNSITVTIPTSTVTFSTDGNGAITAGAPSQIVTYPNDCTPVTVAPNPGYVFEKWTLAGADYSTENPITVTDVATDMTLIAVFTADAPDIKVTEEDGTPISNGVTTIDFGSTPIGTPASLIFHVYNNGGAVLNITSSATTAGSDFSMSTVGTSIAAGGSKKINVVFSPTALGTRAATLTIVSDDADEATFTFDLTGVGTNNPPVAVTRASDTRGSTGALVRLSGSGSYDPDTAPNTSLTYTWTFIDGPMTPFTTSTLMEPRFIPTLAGSYIYRLTVDDGAATDDEDIQIVVDMDHTVTVTADTGGKVRLGLSGIAGTTVREGVADGNPSSNFYPVPDTGYDFVQWSDANTDNPRQFPSVTGNISVTAEFQLKTYTVNFTAGANGTVTGATSQTVNYGAAATSVTAVPDAGAHFIRWMDGATVYSTDQTVTITDVTADKTLAAEFGVGAPEIAVTYDGANIAAGGSISIHSLTQKDYTFTVTNTGGMALDLSGVPRVNLLGFYTSQFELLSAPGSSIASEGQASFVLRYKPTIGATHVLIISIDNNDPDEAPFVFTVNASAHKPTTSKCAMGGGFGGTLLPLLLAMTLVFALRSRRGRRQPITPGIE